MAGIIPYACVIMYTIYTRLHHVINAHYLSIIHILPVINIYHQHGDEKKFPGDVNIYTSITVSYIMCHVCISFG